MNRIRTQDTAERVGRALSLVPPRVLARIDMHVFEGDAAFAGFTHGGTFVSKLDGATINWRDSAFYTAPHNQVGPKDRRAPTVVLPSRRARTRTDYPSVKTILHEIGHALMYSLDGFARGRPRRRTVWLWDRQTRSVGWWQGVGCFPSLGASFSNYAPDSFVEQFAEAFAFWLHPSAHYVGGGRPAEAFYAADQRRWDAFGERPSNRRLLAFFNELAGWPSDLPPRILR